VGDIIVGKSDDIVSGDAVADKDLVSVEDIRLMSVVVVSLGSGNEDSVVSSVGANDSEAESKSEQDASHDCQQN